MDRDKIHHTPTKAKMGFKEVLMSLDTFTQMTLTGVNLGLMYALIAIGLTLIFGIMRIIQYAHGELFMLGAYVLYYWFAVMKWPYWLGILASAVIIFVLGVGLQVLLFRPLHGKNILYSPAVSMGFMATMKAFMIVIMGGLGSVVGALIGGFIIGFIDSFLTTIISADVAYIMGFLAIFFFFFFKPAGLFGQQWE